MEISAVTIVCITILLVFLHTYIFRKLQYWSRRDIPYIKPTPFFGNLLEVFRLKCNFGEKLSNIYFQLNEPVVGIFMLHKPALLIRDPNLIREVLIENFQSFSHKTLANAFDENTNPDEATGFFVAKHDTWRRLRKMLTPAYSFYKIKSEKENVERCSEKMLDYIVTLTEVTKEVNIRDICIRYTTEVLSSVFFGIEAECFEDENSPLRLMTQRLFNYRIFSRGFQTAMFFISPTISKIFKLEFFDKATAKTLLGILTHQQKKQTGSITKNNYLGIVTDAMKTYTGRGNLLFTSLEVFGAGYEAVGSSLSFAFYQIVRNSEIQRKLRLDIMENIGEGNKFTYEHLSRMKYLNAFVKELLRMYPIVPFVDRVCTQNHVIHNPSILIDKGMHVYVSILGIHYDPYFYPNPHCFQPERFYGEKINWSVYFPFGKGPKMCIAKKYSEMVIKFCIVHLLIRFELKCTSKTPQDITFNSKGFSLQPSEDIFLELHAL